MRTRYIRLAKACIAIAILALPAFAFAANSCLSKKHGAWSSSGTWKNCGNNVPQNGDTVTISHNITLDADTSVLAGLTINSGSSLAASGTGKVVKLKGTLNNSGTLSIAGDTIQLFGNLSLAGSAASWAFDSLDFQWQSYAVSFASGTSFTWNASGATPIQNFGNGASFNTGGNSAVTVNLSRAGNQTVATTASGSNAVYPNLTTSGSGTKTANSGTLDIRGSLTVGSGTTFNISNSAVSLKGNFSNSGTLTTGWNDFSMVGTAAQTMAGTTSFQKLLINNANGVTLTSGDVTILSFGTLTLTAGALTTASTNKIIIPTTCDQTSNWSRGSGYVSGNLRLTFPNYPASCTYPLGSGGNYAPITVGIPWFSNITSAGGSLTGSTASGEHLQIGASGLDSTKDVNRYWTLGASGDTFTSMPSGGSYNLTLQFASSEVDMGADVTTFSVGLYKSSTWTTGGSASGTSGSWSGLSSFGSFAVGAKTVSMTCYTDTFSDLSNWAVGNVSGNFGNPVVTGGHLRLTDASNQVSTYAILQRLFPASGNKIVVEFNHYAYGGTGADGVGVVLSDASIAPVAGAFGGSMGYAQKQVSAGGDTTHVGFTGGWLGIALDEYGNFSNDTEGRTGGSAPGLTPDSVALRGSGSGYVGYNYLAGTGTLSPGIDVVNSGSPAPGYKYRITVDHSNGINAYTTVERDTTGTGNSYTTLISSFDAKAAAGQAAVPTNWFLSFTGSTGGSTNIHEVANLKVCSNSQKTISLDHVRIYHDGAAQTCNAEPITITACADAACSTLYLGSVTVNLTTTGGTWSTNPVTVTGGSTQVTLSNGTAGSVTVGGTVTSPSSIATICYNGSSEVACSSYPLTYTLSTSCSWDAVEVGANPATDIYTKIAGTAFSLDVVRVSSGAVKTDYTGGPVLVDLVDPSASSGNCSDTNAGLTTPASSHTFVASDKGRWTVPFTYANAAKNIKVRMRDSSGVACSTDDFSIRPYALSVLSSPTTANADTAKGQNVTATPKLKAGSDTFTVTTTAVNSSGAAVTGYTGTPKVNTSQLTGTSTLGTLSPLIFQTTTTGTFTYSEVGYVHFGEFSLYDDTWAGNDIAKGDCTNSDFSNTPNSSGKYGCNFGNSSNLSPNTNNHFWAGRFIPDHFAITAGATTAACRNHGTGDPTDFTYYGQDGVKTDFKIEAQASGNTATQNYTGNYAKLGLTTYGNYNFTAATLKTGSALASSSTAPSGSWASGVASVSAMHQISRPTSLSPDGGPNSVTISANTTDSDGVTVASATAVSSATEFRYGRLHLANAFGSELLDLSMFGQVEYYAGSGWVINTADSCTQIGVPTVTTTLSTNASSTNTTPWTVSAGSLGLKMSKPSATGYADVTFDLTNLGYLKIDNMINNKDARATFGIPKTNSRVIYRRESF